MRSYERVIAASWGKRAQGHKAQANTKALFSLATQAQMQVTLLV